MDRVYNEKYLGYDIAIYEWEARIDVDVKYPCGHVVEVVDGLTDVVSIEKWFEIAKKYIDGLVEYKRDHCDDDLCKE